jgi:DNA-binding PadR family transcriptional regulator
MLDKDLIKALIDETGEIVYSLTEKGKKYRL